MHIPLANIKSVRNLLFKEFFLQIEACQSFVNEPPLIYNLLTYEKNHLFKYALLVCLGVCLYPKNVKTAEPIGPKSFVGHHSPREGL